MTERFQRHPDHPDPQDDPKEAAHPLTSHPDWEEIDRHFADTDAGQIALANFLNNHGLPHSQDGAKVAQRLRRNKDAWDTAMPGDVSGGVSYDYDTGEWS